jgi:cytosine permease
MGAVIFADHWLFPKLGLVQNYAEKRGLRVSWPAAAAWVISLLVVLLLPMEIFFKGLPGWFLAVVIYILLSKVMQRKPVMRSSEV